MEAADDISYCVADLEDAVENVFLAQNSSISIFTTYPEIYSSGVVV